MLYSYITQWWYIRADNSGRKRGCVRYENDIMYNDSQTCVSAVPTNH